MQEKKQTWPPRVAFMYVCQSCPDDLGTPVRPVMAEPITSLTARSIEVEKIGVDQIPGFDGDSEGGQPPRSLHIPGTNVSRR